MKTILSVLFTFVFGSGFAFAKSTNTVKIDGFLTIQTGINKISREATKTNTANTSDTHNVVDETGYSKISPNSYIGLSLLSNPTNSSTSNFNLAFRANGFIEHGIYFSNMGENWNTKVFILQSTKGLSGENLETINGYIVSKHSSGFYIQSGIDRYFDNFIKGYSFAISSSQRNPINIDSLSVATTNYASLFATKIGFKTPVAELSILYITDSESSENKFSTRYIGAMEYDFNTLESQISLNATDENEPINGFGLTFDVDLENGFSSSIELLSVSQSVNNSYTTNDLKTKEELGRRTKQIYALGISYSIDGFMPFANISKQIVSTTNATQTSLQVENTISVTSISSGISFSRDTSTFSIAYITKTGIIQNDKFVKDKDYMTSESGFEVRYIKNLDGVILGVYYNKVKHSKESDSDLTSAFISSYKSVESANLYMGYKF